MFGQERGDALDSILLNIEKTVSGEPAYPTIESRAAHLLYFVIKDHPLNDGNKRTGSLLFPGLPASEQRAARVHRPSAILRHGPRGPQRCFSTRARPRTRTS